MVGRELEDRGREDVRTGTGKNQGDFGGVVSGIGFI